MKFTAFAALLSLAPAFAKQRQLSLPGEGTCETAFAQDGSPQSGNTNEQCFDSPAYRTGFFDDTTNNRWGWYLDLGGSKPAPKQTFPIFAAAGQCDTSKGFDAGSVTVEITGDVCQAMVVTAPGVYLEQMHFNCGCEPYALTNQGAKTLAPGQYDDMSGSGMKVGSYSGSVSLQGVTCSRYYAIVHINACVGSPPPVSPPIAAPTRPQVEGDPHFKAWSGKWFDYMGQCDLLMTQAPKFDGVNDLNVHIRTKIQYDYSYVEAAAIKIGDDILEVGGYGDYAVNGVDTPYLGGHAGRIGGYDLYHNEVSKKKNTYDIVLGPNENITVASYKQLVSVIFNVNDPEKYFANSNGIIGSLNGDMLSRSGEEMDPEANEEAYGQEWQITDEEPMIFRTAREPQYPAKCEMPVKSASAQRRLGESMAEEAAMKACAHKTGVQFNNCVYDVMAIGDLELADAGTF